MPMTLSTTVLSGGSPPAHWSGDGSLWLLGSVFSAATPAATRAKTPTAKIVLCRHGKCPVFPAGGRPGKRKTSFVALLNGFDDLRAAKAVGIDRGSGVVHIDARRLQGVTPAAKMLAGGFVQPPIPPLVALGRQVVSVAAEVPKDADHFLRGVGGVGGLPGD